MNCLFLSSLEFGAHSPVVMSSSWCSCISQPSYPKSTIVPVCTDGSISVELVAWEYAHILTDTVFLTCVLRYVSLHMRTPRNTGIRVFFFSIDMILCFLQIGHLCQFCLKQVHWHHFSYRICSLCVSL